MEPEKPAETIPVFLCYRQVDGASTARWLFDGLNGKPLGDLPGETPLDIYFDQGAPAVADWSRVHRQSLERAKAFLFLCTPGAYARFDEGEAKDWVHAELDWWLENRATVAPILIDTTGEAERWMPPRLRELYPNAQRVLVRLDAWTPEERASSWGRILDQIREGIRLSETAVLYEDIEEQRRRREEVERLLENERDLTDKLTKNQSLTKLCNRNVNHYYLYYFGCTILEHVPECGILALFARPNELN